MMIVHLLLLYGDFLYFPEDKKAYIPAAVELILLFVLCFAVFFLVKKISKIQEMKTKELEKRMLRERKQNKDTIIKE